MEALIIIFVIAIMLLIAAPYIVWSAITLIPRLFWACSKIMAVLILLIIFGYGVSMIIEFEDTELEVKENLENPPLVDINYNEEFYKEN